MKKCLGINTPIIMFDGSIKMVQDIKINDLIMGDYSRSRKIIRITSGNDEMFKVITRTSDYYVVNRDHILTFKVSKYIIPDGDNCFLFLRRRKKEYDSIRYFSFIF